MALRHGHDFVFVEGGKDGGYRRFWNRFGTRLSCLLLRLSSVCGRNRKHQYEKDCDPGDPRDSAQAEASGVRQRTLRQIPPGWVLGIGTLPILTATFGRLPLYRGCDGIEQQQKELPNFL